MAVIHVCVAFSGLTYTSSHGEEVTSRGGSVANVTDGDAGCEKVPVLPHAGKGQIRDPSPGKAARFMLCNGAPEAEQVTPSRAPPGPLNR
ncbi:unnamed protein product [Lota lota]